MLNHTVSSEPGEKMTTATKQPATMRVQKTRRAVPVVFEGYCATKVPFIGHIILTSVFLTSFASAFAASLSSRRKITDPTWRDLILLSVATHKLSRLVTKDRVTSPFRAPFTRLVRDSGSGEVEEEARGRGLQRAIGQLLTCPFCVAPWIAATMLTGLSNAPRFTRMVAATFSIVSGSDFLNRVYYGAKQIGESDGK
jgi:Protein of unknown function (DUF1360)